MPRMITIFMELKHLIIAAIVANAAKSGLDSGTTVKDRP
ncbi:hypothetical protein PMO01_19820 [Pseudomonas moraviensis R28-S]|uniref:Uncharacterized protein n=1 Tax=Pseudomonas moraviensis R28-S TaxID=1395516 RepID=V8R5D8_9PSED|nr:hypothetical protein PMO01_19820 [Pseudomonas moraviensis R28-S]